MQIRLLEDDPALRDALVAALTDCSIAVMPEQASGSDEIHQWQPDCDLVLLGEHHEANTLVSLKQALWPTPVVILLSNPSTANVVKSMRAGATDVLDRSMPALHIAQSVRATCEAQQAPLDASPTHSYFQPEDCRAMHDLQAAIHRIGKTDSTALIVGETGTGKELVALQLHAASARRDQNMITVNCAAIPETLIEAELFGYEKGAFTGASTANKGIFRAADGGTLLLDEISEMPLSLQAKLLRALQERKVTPLGSQREIDVDVRVIATTNREMLSEISNGKFREDLFYRLNVFPLTTQHLAQRTDDIIPISSILLARHSMVLDDLPSIDDEAADILLSYNWPGNVRELENVLQRAIVLSTGGKIMAGDIMVDGAIQERIVKSMTTEMALSKSASA